MMKKITIILALLLSVIPFLMKNMRVQTGMITRGLRKKTVSLNTIRRYGLIIKPRPQKDSEFLRLRN
jgi:hypothetical protein